MIWQVISLMGDRPCAGRLLGALAGLCLACASASADAVTQSDLQAALRSLSFLDSLQHHSSVSIGVVYADGAEGAAARTAGMLSALRGLDSASIHASPISADELQRGEKRFDALYLMPGMSADGKRIGDYVRQRKLVSVSNDPACLQGRYCVLMVRTNAGVDIVLDTGLADAVDARFASVFTLMVKRK